MTQIIDFFFDIWVSLLTLIKSYWILSVFLLLKIFNWITDLINETKSQ